MYERYQTIRLHLMGNTTIVMILDNARIHHAKLLQPFLEENTRLHFVFLPTYSPRLNIVEGL
ncbi:transposase [Paenibacillus popilliae]|uniref:transposase n=1 Tax=Paenibacillus popilliae TaxID=78057 RepID=UPI000B82977F